MKVRVKTAFKDKITNQVYKVGDELEMSVQRVNEVLTVGNFIELVEQDNEHTGKPEETLDQKMDENDSGHASVDQKTDGNGEDQEGYNQETGEAPKQTGRRKRTNK